MDAVVAAAVIISRMVRQKPRRFGRCRPERRQRPGLRTCSSTTVAASRRGGRPPACLLERLGGVEEGAESVGLMDFNDAVAAHVVDGGAGRRVGVAV